MKKIALLMSVAVLSAAPAWAEDDVPSLLPGHFAGTVGFASDYMFRSISQTQNNPAIQGNIDFLFDNGLKFGVWGSNIDFNDNADDSAEFDLYAAYTKTFDKLTLEAGLIRYTYPGQNSDADFNYNEVYGLAGYDFGMATLTGTLNYSPDYFASSGDGWYPRLAAHVPSPVTFGIPGEFALDGWVSRQWIEKNADFGTPDYTDYGIGPTYTLNGFTAKAQYIGTNLDDSECANDLCEGRFVFSLTKAF